MVLKERTEKLGHGNGAMAASARRQCVVFWLGDGDKDQKGFGISFNDLWRNPDERDTGWIRLDRGRPHVSTRPAAMVSAVSKTGPRALT
jgi:hypothetical protein